jgi:hypothetical protein
MSEQQTPQQPSYLRPIISYLLSLVNRTHILKQLGGGSFIDSSVLRNLPDHDHSGDSGDGGTFDAANLTSGAAADGHVLTADGAGGADWEAPAALSAGSIEQATGNVSNPPTEAELVAALGSPAVANPSAYVLNDNGGGTREYLCVSDGARWHYVPLVKAAWTTPTVTVASSATLVTGGSPQDWHGRASVKRRADGVLVLAYRDGSHHAINDGALHVKFSNDDGATWTAPDTTLSGAAVSGFPMNPTGKTASQDAGEPWLYLAADGTLILHMWRIDYDGDVDGTYQSVSSDGGETWSASAAVDFSGIADDIRIFATDDDFTAPDGTIYAGARMYDDAAQANCKSILIKSIDNGATWAYVSDISSYVTPTEEVGLEYLGGTTIIAILRADGNDKTYKALSTDMGASWSALSDITSTFQAAGRPRVYTRSHLKGLTNWWDDPVLLACGFVFTTPGQSLPGRRNAVWISPDRGSSWSGPFYVAAADDDGGYGDMFYDSTNGRYVFVVNKGSATACDLMQYNLTITGV